MDKIIEAAKATVKDMIKIIFIVFPIYIILTIITSAIVDITNAPEAVTGILIVVVFSLIFVFNFWSNNDNERR